VKEQAVGLSVLAFNVTAPSIFSRRAEHMPLAGAAPVKDLHNVMQDDGRASSQPNVARCLG
jgi:hypothetical protein